MELPLFLDSAVSGTIQGATELLPISSTGHLLLFSSILGIQLALSDIAFLHLGTLASIIIAMREHLRKLLSVNVLVPLAIAAIPAGIVGLLFEDCIESTVGTTPTILFSLVFWGIVMIVVDRWSRGKKAKTTSLSDITLTQAAVVGVAQMLALIPGTSRSGITTIAGISAGMSPTTALAFSFLSGIPLLAGSGLYGGIKLVSSDTVTTEKLVMIVAAIVISAIVGLGAAIILKKRITKGILTQCGIYRIILSIVIAIGISL